MWQEIISWIVIAVCVALAVRAIILRFRGKSTPCDCGCGNTPGKKASCIPSTDSCSGCAVADLCRKPEKK